MTTRRTIRRGAIVVASVAALFGAAGLATGQVPAKPVPKDTAVKPKPAVAPKTATPQIKISKETTSGGDVVPMLVKTDTVVQTIMTFDPRRDDSIRADQYKLDSAAESLTRMRLMRDTRMRVAEAQERMRAAALADKKAEAAALRRSLERGMYFGIAGGASAPQRAVRNGYTGGYNVTLPVGYDATDLPLGIRADLAVDHMNGTRTHNQFNETLAASGDITVWSFNMDLEVRLPTPGSGTRTHFYALGGLGAHRVTGGIYGTNDAKAGDNLTFNHAATKLGWNAGAGAAIKWGAAEVFIESRFFQVKTDLPYHMAGGLGTYTSFTPVLIGLQWF